MALALQADIMQPLLLADVEGSKAELPGVAGTNPLVGMYGQ